MNKMEAWFQGHVMGSSWIFRETRYFGGLDDLFSYIYLFNLIINKNFCLRWGVRR
jgi:hypothetical protein